MTRRRPGAWTSLRIKSRRLDCRSRLVLVTPSRNAVGRSSGRSHPGKTPDRKLRGYRIDAQRKNGTMYSIKLPDALELPEPSMRSIAIRSGVVVLVPGDPPLFPHDAVARRLWAFWRFPIRCVSVLRVFALLATHTLAYITMDTVKKTADTVVSGKRPSCPPSLPPPALPRSRSRGGSTGTGAT